MRVMRVGDARKRSPRGATGGTTVFSPNVTTWLPSVRVYLILDERASLNPPLGEAVDTFVRREDAERFLADVRRDEPELAGYLRIEERELEAGGRN